MLPIVRKIPNSKFQIPNKFEFSNLKISWKLATGNWKLQSGFTLIELLVVISIIGLLATLLVANFNAARERARDAERKADLRNIQTALRLYYNDTGRYPCEETSGSPSGIRACDANPLCGSVAACAWGGAWQIASRTYMSILPGDPSPGGRYRYDQVDNDTYTLEACLENPSDTSCSGNAGWCPVGSGCIYRVRP